MAKRIQSTIIIITVLLCAFVFALEAQNPKGKYGTFVLKNGTVQTVTRGVIQNGSVVIVNGKITAVGTNLSIPAEAEEIDCTGQWIFPGMIDSGTRLGLTEVRSDSRTTDFNEIGDIIPQMKALTAINPNSVLIPVTRINGVTTVLAAPEGDLIPGTSALINLYGYTPDQMFGGFEGLVLNFPKAGREGLADRRSEEDVKKAYDKAIARLNEVWDMAVQYHLLDSATKSKGVKYYPEMQAMMAVLRGERSVMVEANAAKDIQAALQWISARKVKKVILTGVSEGWRVAAEIKKAGIPVIVGPVLSLPDREYDRYDRAYSNPGLLKKAGVKVALRTKHAENVRNLPYHAAFAAAYGLGKEEALRSVTIVPAEIFGVADRLGSIEVGKNATLFVCDGDPFETRTAINLVFIDGWNVPMVSRQTQLYEEFLNREPGLSKK